MSAINEQLFSRVRSLVDRVCNKATNSPKMVLTEADMQAWVFSTLVYELTEVKEGLVDVHCQSRFLNYQGKLGKEPDLVLYDSSEYSVGADGALFKRKGYTFWGSAIAFEFKLQRSHQRNPQIGKWKADVDKLRDIRRLHYSDGNSEQFYCAVCILAKGAENIELSQKIIRYGQQENIPVWLYRIEGTVP